MKFVIEEKIFQEFPDLKVGGLIIKGINNDKRNSFLESLLRGISAQRGKEFKAKNFEEEKTIAPWYRAYGNFGANPKKTMPSIAALLKRVSADKEIPHLNPLVDIINYFSLKHLLPMGGEDLDWLAGDLKLAFTKGGEAFRPLGSIDVELAAEGEVAYMDKGGITCRYWNYRECERTKFTNKTVNAVVLIEDLSKMHLDQFGEIIQEMSHAISKYIGGYIEPFILTEDNNEIDLGVEGRKTADDGKVSKQEKAHFIQMEKLKKNFSAKKKAVKKVKNDTKAPQMSIESAIEHKEGIAIEDDNLLKSRIAQIAHIATAKAFPKAVIPEIKVEEPSSAGHGDYSTNIAMQLAGDLPQNPREIASEILSQIKDEELISKVEIAGPGFINFFLNDEFLNTEIEKILEEKDKYGSLEFGKNKNIIVEYSSPNIAKPIGVHNVLTTVIGQSLANIFKNLGFKVTSWNYLGDWGTQFGKLIHAYKKWGDKKQIEADPITELQKLYVKFHDEAEQDLSLDDEGRAEFKKLEEGDKENLKLLKWVVEESMKEAQKLYDKLGGIEFDVTKGESYFEDKMPELLKEGKEKGIFVKGKEGAYIVEYDDPNIAPFVVQKKDGTTLYSTRDLALMKYRIQEMQPAKIIIVVDIAQTMHFKQLFAACDRFPWYHGEAEHVWFGRMHMKDGKASTRKGNVVLVMDLIDEAIKRTSKIIEEKNPELKNKDEVIQKIAVGSIKYTILSQNRTTDITFDWDRMLSLDGNSAPYLQYTYARAQSIIRRAAEFAESEDSSTQAALSDPGDTDQKIHALASHLPKFAEHTARAAQEYKPNLLANYLHELAQRFNSFYNGVPVLKASSETQKSQRLKLVRAASQILKNGLNLLGIEVVEEM